MKLLAITVCVVSVLLNVDEVQSGEFDCVKSFQQMERSLISKELNLDSMSDAFFPPNRQASIAANVYYYFVANDSEQMLHLKQMSYDYAFRWSNSPVFELIRPELLQSSSLYVYRGQTTSVKILLDPVCGSFPLQTRVIDEKTCKGDVNKSDPVKMVNRLTTHLKSYILDNRLLGVDEQNRGYSSFLFNRENEKDHCVIGQDDMFMAIRICMSAVLTLLPIMIMIITPWLIISKYNWIHQTLRKDSDRLYYFWATIFVAVIVESIIMVSDVTVIIHGFSEDKTHYSDVKWNYIMALIFITGLPIINYALTLISITVCTSKNTKIKENPITWPNSSCTWTNNVLGLFLYTSTLIAVAVYGVQIVVFHSYFILLALIASPIHSCFILLLYISVLCLSVVVVAICIKAIMWAKVSRRRCFIVICISCIAATAASCFIYAIIHIVLLVGEHRNNGGVLTFIGDLAPTAFLSILAYIGNKALKLFKTKQNRQVENVNNSLITTVQRYETTAAAALTHRRPRLYSHSNVIALRETRV